MTTLRKAPNWEHVPGVLNGYSNADHTFDEGVREGIVSNQLLATHSAWDFNGTFWFEDGMYHEAVHVYHAHEATLSDKDLDELIRRVNDEYGSG